MKGNYNGCNFSELDENRYSDRNWLVCIALWFFAGSLGAHRFYCGKIASGFVYLFTFGAFFIGYIVDMVLLLTGKFKDCDGNIVKRK